MKKRRTVTLTRLAALRIMFCTHSKTCALIHSLTVQQHLIRISCIAHMLSKRFFYCMCFYIFLTFSRRTHVNAFFYKLTNNRIIYLQLHKTIKSKARFTLKQNASLLFMHVGGISHVCASYETEPPHFG